MKKFYLLTLFCIVIALVGCSGATNKLAIRTYKILLKGKVEYYDTTQKRNLPVSWAKIETSLMVGSHANESGDFTLTIVYPLKKNNAKLMIKANDFTTRTYSLNAYSNFEAKDSTVDLGNILLSFSGQPGDTTIQ